jgi:hypothetical protein
LFQLLTFINILFIFVVNNQQIRDGSANSGKQEGNKSGGGF